MTKNMLKDMLSWRMNVYDEEHEIFVKKYFRGLRRGKEDFLQVVGKNPKILYVCCYGAYARTPGRNNIEIDGHYLYLNKKTRHCSDNQFACLSGAYIMLQLIEKNTPGIYLFMPSILSIDEHKYNVGGMKRLLDGCDATLFIGTQGREFITKTDSGASGYRTASDEFTEYIANKLDLKVRLDDNKDYDSAEISGKSLVLPVFKYIIPENVGIPIGVERSDLIESIQFPAPAEVVVDFQYVENLILKLSNLQGAELPIKRNCFRTEYVFSKQDHKKYFGANEDNKNFWTWLKNLF